MQLRAKLLEEARKKDAQEEETDEPAQPTTQDLIKKALQRQTMLKQEAVPIEDQNAIEELFAVGTSRAVLETMFSPETVTRVLGKEDDTEANTKKSSSNNRRDRESSQPRPGPSARRASIATGGPQPRPGSASRRTSIATGGIAARRTSIVPDGRQTIRRSNTLDRQQPSLNPARQMSVRRSLSSDGVPHLNRATITRPGIRPGVGLSRNKSESSRSSRNDSQRRQSTMRPSNMEVGPRTTRGKSHSGHGSPPHSKERSSSGRRTGEARQASWHRGPIKETSETDHTEGRRPSKKLHHDMDQSDGCKSSKKPLGAETTSSKQRKTTSQKSNEMTNTWQRAAKKAHNDADHLLSNHSQKSSRSNTKGDSNRRPGRTKGSEREMERSRKPHRSGSDPSIASRGQPGSNNSLGMEEGTDNAGSSKDNHHDSFANASQTDDSFGAEANWPATNKKSASADLPGGNGFDEWPAEAPANVSFSVSHSDDDAFSIDSSSGQDLELKDEGLVGSTHHRRLHTSEAMAKARG
jgi:hypothetical protein